SSPPSCRRPVSADHRLRRPLMTKWSAPQRPLPPCGGGTGWGGIPDFEYRIPPTPCPSPQGGEESAQRLACRVGPNSAVPVGLFRLRPRGSDIPQLPTTSGAVRRRRAASTLSAVILPVRGFSSEGMFSMVMVRSEESDLTTMVWVFLVTSGSAQISARVAS